MSTCLAAAMADVAQAGARMLLVEQLGRVRADLLAEAISAHGHIEPVGRKALLEDCYSLISLHGTHTIYFWYNCSAGSTHVSKRQIPAELAVHLDKSASLVEPLDLGTDLAYAAAEAFSTGAREVMVECKGGIVATLTRKEVSDDTQA